MSNRSGPVQAAGKYEACPYMSPASRFLWFRPLTSVLRFQMTFDGLPERHGVHPSGKMHRALAVNRIPAGRVGTAIELNFQADADGSLLQR